ncbi:MAG: histidine phosphatase family protein [Shinella sp.]|nr:histidine phosphatase family protein [Shinella sp.]
MTVTFLLVRHAAHDDCGRFLAGRSAGISLGPAGREQAERLARRMAGEKANAVHTSPRERTMETAAAIVQACLLPDAIVSPSLDEIDFGAWSGQHFEALDADPAWRRWNTLRSLSRTPGGESMLDVQRRALQFIEGLIEPNDGRKLVLVSHADVIKSVVSHVLGLPIDAWPRFEISPASITSVAIGNWGAKVLTLNEVVS